MVALPQLQFISDLNYKTVLKLLVGFIDSLFAWISTFISKYIPYFGNNPLTSFVVIWVGLLVILKLNEETSKGLFWIVAILGGLYLAAKYWLL